MRSLSPPGAVLDIAKRLEGEGFETWCVGGAVRDALLGHPHLDWDLATAATPQQVRRLFPRTVPVGIEFGTVGVLDREGTMHEVTTFRRDVETDGRHAVVTFGATIDEDLARRDFTLNAIAYHPKSHRLHDPFNGQQDIARRLIRAVGDPRERMREDRLRALRAIRFAARFGFDIDPDTWRAIVESAPHLGRLSAERVKQELEKTMEQVERPGRALELWRESGALRVLLPALDGMSSIALRTLDCLPRATGKRASQRKMIRLAALLGELSPREAEKTARQLRFSNAQIAWIRAVVEHARTVHSEMTDALSSGATISPARMRQWIASAGRTRIASVMRLAAARFCAQREARQSVPAPETINCQYRRVVRSAFREPVELGDLAVNGDDLRVVGVAEGPEMGWVLHRLLDVVLEEPRRNTVEEMQSLAAELLKRYRNGER
jgi:tRNA nucleotidyltransferase (CCA-adding enzyme)